MKNKIKTRKWEKNKFLYTDIEQFYYLCHQIAKYKDNTY
mgnify:CR=1 FL=1